VTSGWAPPRAEMMPLPPPSSDSTKRPSVIWRPRKSSRAAIATGQSAAAASCARWRSSRMRLGVRARDGVFTDGGPPAAAMPASSQAMSASRRPGVT
jgi:hypothetical protein